VNLTKIIIEMQGKLEFYMKNSNIHPEISERDFQTKEISGLLENFNVLADKVLLFFYEEIE